MLRLVVNADDFGLSEAINDGILEAHERGIVTSVSLMAVGASFDHAIRRLRAAPTLGVGVHLTLVEEQPLLPRGDVASLVSERGTFWPHAKVFAQRYFARRIVSAEVVAELDAQIQRVLAHGIRVTHLDSHQHVHMLPGVLRIVSTLATRYKIPVVRFPTERITLRSLFERGPARVGQLLALRFFCLWSRSLGVTRAQHFAGFLDGGRLDHISLQRVLQRLPPEGTVELMCHPGRTDTRSPYLHWGYRWEEELSALTNPALREQFSACGVNLISHADLACAPQ